MDIGPVSRQCLSNRLNDAVDNLQFLCTDRSTKKVEVYSHHLTANSMLRTMLRDIFSVTDGRDLVFKSNALLRKTFSKIVAHFPVSHYKFVFAGVRTAFSSKCGDNNSNDHISLTFQSFVKVKSIQA